MTPNFAEIIRYYVKPRAGTDSVMRPVEWLDGVDECAAALSALFAATASPRSGQSHRLDEPK